MPSIEKAAHVYVGYSGGLDSHVLLHALSQQFDPQKITALHINHQLSKHAGHWQQHCRQQADALGVKFIAETVTVEAQGEGVEQAARQARYAVFNRHLQTDDLLLLAHHGDDQVETVLYRLLRGSGPRGLAGIPQSRPLGKGQLLRPLLGYSRSDLETYARANSLQWIEDESNNALDFDRNYLRHQVVPALAQRWPEYRARISRSAELCQQAEQLLQEVAQQDLQHCREHKERLGWSLSIPELACLSRQRQNNLLRYWVRSRQLAIPGHRIMETVLTELLNARDDAKPLVFWSSRESGGEFRRYHQRLYLLSEHPPEAESKDCLPWDLSPQQPLQLPDGSVLMTETTRGRGLRRIADQPVTIRFRQGGERCKPVGRHGSNTLKKILQEYELEPWLRDSVPLIYQGEKLAAVGDLFICEGFDVGPEEKGMSLNWQFLLS